MADQASGRDTTVPRCLLADDHEVLLASLALLLESEGFMIVGVATTGREALRLLESLKPDLAVLDLRLPEITGIEVAREATRLGLPTAIVIHTAEAGPTLVRDALAAGVRGVAGKAVPPEPLLRAIAAALAGKVFVDPSLLPERPWARSGAKPSATR